MKTFLFWFKMLSAVKLVIAGFLLHWYYKISIALLLLPENLVKNSIFILVQSFSYVVVLLLVVGLCIIDGIYMDRRIKIILNILLCLFWTGLTLSSIFYPIKHDTSIIKVNDSYNLSISVLSIYIDSLKVLAVFFWKQAIYLILNPNKCVNIRKSPFFKWE